MDYTQPLGRITAKTPKLLVSALNKRWQEMLDPEDEEQKFVLKTSTQGEWRAQLLRKSQTGKSWIRDFAYHIGWDKELGCYSV